MMEHDFVQLVQRGYQARAGEDRVAALALFMLAERAVPSHVGALLEIATELRALDRLEEAEAICASILATEPDHLGALVQRAHIERARDDHPAALADFQAAMRREPLHLGLMIEISKELVHLKRDEAASEMFQRILAVDPQHFESMTELAFLARRRNDHAQSLRQFLGALELYPTHLGLMLEAAHDLRTLCRFEEAQAMFRRCHDVSGGNAAALIGLGLSARRIGDCSAAIRHFSAALAIDPAISGGELELAQELRDAGCFDQARDQIARLLRKDPNDYEALLLGGRLGRAMADQAMALTAFRRALAMKPADPQTLVECALEERIAGHPDDSARLLEQACTIDPTHLPALLQLSEHALLADEPEQALEVARRAITHHPSAAPPYVQASRALALLGRLGEALCLLDRGAARCSERQPLIAQRIEILRQAGRWQTARSVLDTLDPLCWNDELWLQACKLDLQLGDFDSIASRLGTAPVATNRRRAIGVRLQGELAESLWDFATARERLAEAVAISPLEGQIHNMLARYCMIDLDFKQARVHLKRAVELDASAIRLRRNSPNPAQSHIGQLIDELRTDRDVIDQLALLRDQPPEAQMAPLLALVASNPGHTGAAMRLLIAARRANLFAGAAITTAGGSPIPRLITQFWSQKSPPPDVSATMKSWDRHHPGTVIRRMDDAAAFSFIRDRYDEQTITAFQRSREPAQRADLFRLAWLYEMGGVYVDADDLCLAPIAELCTPAKTLIVYQEEYGTLGNNFLAATRRHPIIGEALGGAVAAIIRGDGEMIWLKTGPGLLTRAFAVAMARTNLRLAGWLADISVLERHELRRFLLPQIGLAYKRTGLHWMRNIGQQAGAGASRQETSPVSNGLGKTALPMPDARALSP